MGAEIIPKVDCFKSNQGSAYSLLPCTAAPTVVGREGLFKALKYNRASDSCARRSSNRQERELLKNES